VTVEDRSKVPVLASRVCVCLYVYVCVYIYITLLLGYMTYYELQSFIFKLNFLYHMDVGFLRVFRCTGVLISL
jgi:hypothetical protein